MPQPAVASVTAVIELAWDPITRIGDWNVRLATIALAAVILVSLLVAARIARITPVDVTRDVDDRLASPDDPDVTEPNHLRRDDLLYIVVASLPGAVIGGRLGYGLLHADYYAASPGALLDIGQGGFGLTLGLLGGLGTASVVASLLGAPVGRWLHAAILPLLLALGGGKLAMVLGGEGQGVPWDGSLATAYLGPGPWLSLAPEIPSHPAQAYEAVATLFVAVVVTGLLASGAFGRRNGGVFLLGLGLWALGRFAVAFTWRDPVVLGPLRVEQLVLLVVTAASFVLLAVVARGRDSALAAPGGASSRSGRGQPTRVADRDAEPSWPEPESRPRF